VTLELSLLVWSVPLFGLYLGAQSLLYRWKHGVMFAQTARDKTPGEDGVLLGRAQRALSNFLETWPIFIILALAAHLATPGDALVLGGAITWFCSRILYLPLYLGGVFLVRSLVWFAGAIGLLLMFIGVVF
jgi:uncharacterized MAPEG superfamily protein